MGLWAWGSWVERSLGTESGWRTHPHWARRTRLGLGKGEGHLYPIPQEKGPEDLRPIPCVSIGLSGACVLGWGAWGAWFVFIVVSVSLCVSLCLGISASGL